MYIHYDFKGENNITEFFYGSDEELQSRINELENEGCENIVVLCF